MIDFFMANWDWYLGIGMVFYISTFADDVNSSSGFQIRDVFLNLFIGALWPVVVINKYLN